MGRVGGRFGDCRADGDSLQGATLAPGDFLQYMQGYSMTDGGFAICAGTSPCLKRHIAIYKTCIHSQDNTPGTLLAGLRFKKSSAVSSMLLLA